jgi:hypothetical protein
MGDRFQGRYLFSRQGQREAVKLSGRMGLATVLDHVCPAEGAETHSV